VLQAKSGSIRFAGQTLPELPHKILEAGICLVPERRRLFANLTVKENLLIGAHLRKNMNEINEDLERMMALFPIIRERVKQYAGTLSGGEQQMVALARGLMSRPKLLLMDEPSLGLAPLITQQVFDTIVELKGQKITILLAEQNAVQALEIADYAYVLETGHVAFEGTGTHLLEDERVNETYLGIRRKEISI
jgi:branched-chain amino acid transport system ATP-binding protein